jgi:hypothetical protein
MRGGGGEGSGGQSAATPACLSKDIDLNGCVGRFGGAMARPKPAVRHPKKLHIKKENTRVAAQAVFD